jgi:hypothetical protein
MPASKTATATKASFSLKENQKVQAAKQVSTTTSHEGFHNDALQEVKQLKNQIAQQKGKLSFFTILRSHVVFSRAQ